VTWRPYNKFGWWTIHLDKLSTRHEKLLEDLSSVPGITVGAGESRGGYFLNVGVTAHESAMMTDVFLAFEDVVGLCMGGGIEPDDGLWEGARQLRPYQREAARFLCATGGGMLCDQMGLGKGLPNATGVLTPTGYVPIGALRVGDVVCDTLGGTCRVTGVFPQGARPVFRVTMADGTSVLADDQHRWLVRSPQHRWESSVGVVRTTAELLAGGLRTKPSARNDSNRRWFLPDVTEVAFAAQDVPIDPYVLGTMLGDASLLGTVRLHTQDADVLAEVLRRWPAARVCTRPGLSLPGLFRAVTQLGLARKRAWEKYVPRVYLYNTVEVRRALLAGLVDTDAECRKDGTVCYTSTSQQLAEDVAFLVRALGGVASVRPRRTSFLYEGEKREGRVAYVVNIRMRTNPFLAQQARRHRWKPSICARGIEAIEPCGTMATTCISVDAPNALFLTENVIPTHNTTSAIVAAETLRRRVDEGAPVLVIGPKFVRATWKRELLENGAIASPSEFFFATGVKPTREQERELQTARYWFVHYEILEAWRHVLTRPLYAKRPVVAIVDEGHWIRNPKAKRTKAVLASAGIARHRILLTGTPLANRVEDLWVPLTFVDGMGAWGTAFSFASRYTIFQKDQYGWKSHGPARMPEFQHRLSRSYLRREVADVGAEIPDLTRERMLVEPTKDFSAAIKKWAGGDMDRALSRLEDALAAGALGSETLSALTEWRKWTSSVKVPETAALTASLLAEGESVVVFVWQRETAEELARAVGKALVSSREDKATFSYRAHVVHGGIPQATRDAAVEAFQTYAGPQVIFATIEALKEGVTLHAARRVIIHDLDWIPATLLQAEARVHRLGQKRACVATWMVVERSADELIARHLLQKANAMAAAIGDTGAQVAIEGVAPVTEDDIGAKYAAELLGGMG